MPRSFNQTLQQECLDYFEVLCEKHMNHLVPEMIAHYHEERPHQSLRNESPVNQPETETPNGDTDDTKQRIVCREPQGGRLRVRAERRALRSP